MNLTQEMTQQKLLVSQIVPYFACQHQALFSGSQSPNSSIDVQEVES